MATPYHSRRGHVKRYNLFQCTFLTKCISIRNISPFLIRPSVRTGAPSPRGKVLCGPHPYKHQFVERWATPVSTFPNHPRRGYHILYLISDNILYLIADASYLRFLPRGAVSFRKSGIDSGGFWGIMGADRAQRSLRGAGRIRLRLDWVVLTREPDTVNTVGGKDA